MSHKIYVGNLSYNTSEEDLKARCEAFGPVVSCRIITDRDTGRSKGFGFVEFETAEAMQKAIEELNDQEVDGRNLRVNEAEDRPRQGGGGRRAGGGGRY